MTQEAQNIPVEILLWGIQSPINTGMIMRVVEMYQLKLGIYDQFGILNHEEKLKTISDFSCGAYHRRSFHAHLGITELLAKHDSTRIIATSIDEGSVSLNDFVFQANDRIIFGNEYDGISKDIVAKADCCLHIPTPKIYLPKHKSYSPIDTTRGITVANDGVPSHNVAVSVAIISHAVYMQSLTVGLK